jgi:hypothetical protein
LSAWERSKLDAGGWLKATHSPWTIVFGIQFMGGKEHKLAVKE